MIQHFLTFGHPIQQGLEGVCSHFSPLHFWDPTRQRFITCGIWFWSRTSVVVLYFDLIWWNMLLSQFGCVVHPFMYMLWFCSLHIVKPQCTTHSISKCHKGGYFLTSQESQAGNNSAKPPKPTIRTEHVAGAQIFCKTMYIHHIPITNLCFCYGRYSPTVPAAHPRTNSQ